VATATATATAAALVARSHKRRWSFGRWRMRSKLILILFLVSQIPLLAVAGFTIHTARQAMLQQARVNMLGVGTEVARQIDGQLSTWRENILAMSQMPEVIAYASRPTEATARTAVMALKAEATKANYQSVAICRDGKIVLSSSDPDVGADITFRAYFTEAMKGTPVITEPSISTTTNKPALFLSAPIRDAGNQVIAVVRSRLDLYGIWDLVEQGAAQSVPGTVAMLLDNDGIRIAHSASRDNREAVVNSLLYRAVAPLSPEATTLIVAEKRFGNFTTNRVRVLPLPEVAAALASSGSTTFDAAADNSTLRHQSAAIPLRNKPWRLVLQAPNPSFTSAALRMTQVSAAAAVGFGLLTILAAYCIARGVTAPLAQLTDVADRISLGELDAKIRINRKDEMGDLAEAIRRMQTSLQTAIERLRARRTP
jgi:C4-dicarboxylate-specific signal transduction histidine kinase